MIFLQCKFEKTRCSFAKEEYLRLSFSSNAKHIEDKYIKIKKLNSRTLHIKEEKNTGEKHLDTELAVVHTFQYQNLRRT